MKPKDKSAHNRIEISVHNQASLKHTQTHLINIAELFFFLKLYLEIKILIENKTNFNNNKIMANLLINL